MENKKLLNFQVLGGEKMENEKTVISLSAAATRKLLDLIAEDMQHGRFELRKIKRSS